ncbi:MAG: hypothetical protein U0Y10_25880 [Spirosomataceae bacterium]
MKELLLESSFFRNLEHRFLNDSIDAQNEYFVDIFECKTCSAKWYLPEPQEHWFGCFRKKRNWYLYWYAKKILGFIILLTAFWLLGGFEILKFGWKYITNLFLRL